MEITDTRNVHPGQYSIANVRVSYQWDNNPEYPYVAPYLHIELKPEGYMRDRFSEGQSYEVNKHGARKITISHHEFAQINQAFTDEVALCHKILLEHKLMSKLMEARTAQYEQRKADAR